MFKAHFPNRRVSIGAALLLALVASPVEAGLADDVSTSTRTAETPFIAANQVAMDRMMIDMAIKPSGDADADFAAMMIPHHQGAMAMAVAELRWGRNEHLRRIAQEIIVEQQQEIAAMRLALDQRPPPSRPAPTNPRLPARHPQLSNSDRN